MNMGGFSWKTFIGLTQLKRRIAMMTGIPFTRSGMERKIGGLLLKLLGLKK